MAKIKKLITAHVPVDKCNLRCPYCYISQSPPKNYSPHDFKHSAKEIRQALSCKRLGGTCYINLCGGGETLIPLEIVDITRELLEEGHFVELVTNGTITQRIGQLLSFPLELRKHLAFKMSFHYSELLRLNLMDTFFENFNKILNAGASAYLELMADDAYLDIQDEIIQICKERAGAPCHLSVVRDDTTPEIKILSKYTGKDELQSKWEKFDCDMYRFKLSTYYVKRTEFCYAGDWSMYVDLSTGNVGQCYKSNIASNIFENVNKPINLTAIGNNCNSPHCYNSHAFLAWGDIPQLNAPTYCQMRQRVCIDRPNWVNDELAEFYSSKLADSNKEYSEVKKKLVNIKNYLQQRNPQHSIIQTIKIIAELSVGKVKKIWNDKKKESQLNSSKKKIIDKIKAIRKNKNNLIWMLNTPTHGNLGDQAIVYAQYKFLHDLGLDGNVIEINTDLYDVFADGIKAMVAGTDTIIVDGGGNIGTLWISENERIQQMIKDYPNNKIVIFPQTSFYSDDEIGKSEIEKNKVVFEGHKNLYLFVRDENSYNYIKNHFNINCFLVPDIVLYLNNVSSSNKREGIGLCLRKDIERLTSDSQLETILSELETEKIKTMDLSTVICRKVTANDRESVLKNMWDKYASVKLVITDRLHGMIFCAITNTPCIAMDNSSKKVSGVYKWLEKFNNILFIDNVEKLTFDKIANMSKKEKTKSEIDKKYFEPLFEQFVHLQ